MTFRGKSRPELPGFQITPMIDIVFLLLCFFMTSQIFAEWECELDIQLPTATSGSIPERLPGEIIINISRDGTIVINRQVLDGAGLLSILERIAVVVKGQPVLIRADRATPFAHVVNVLDLCRKTDIWNVSFAASTVENAPQ